MNERHRGALVQRGEQVVLADFTEVGAGVVGQQHDPVGVQGVESAHCLVDGLVDVWQGDGGKESELIRVGGNEICAVVVEVPGECGRLGRRGKERGARCRYREDRRGDV